MTGNQADCFLNADGFFANLSSELMNFLSNNIKAFACFTGLHENLLRLLTGIQ